MLPDVKRILIAIIVSLCGIGLALSEEQVIYGPDTVVVVANKSVQGSLKVADAYMKMRGIEKDHLITIEAPTGQHISRSEYLEMIHNPIMKELLDRKLVDAFEGAIDDLGRQTATIFKNNIRYLVLCYGVPTKVRSTGGEQAQLDEDYLNRTFKRTAPHLFKSFHEKPLSKNEAAVDGELSLLLTRHKPLRGFVPNPLHRKKDRTGNTDILRVTRLDGPSPEAVLGMLESSMAGEQKGLRGRAYVDEDGRKGGFEIGNTWMANTAALLKSLEFDTSHNTDRATFAITDRFDAPVLYAGWYAGSCTGPFLLPGFRFPEGAVAAHLHSASAENIRTATGGWVGPFVERGVACTFGNVSEPYLRLTHHFDAFFTALSEGWNFGDAAYYALPGLSWQGVAVGDPLYRPFARKIDQQKVASDLAMAYANAQLLLEDKQKKKAIEALAIFIEKLPKDPCLWGLYAEVADTLAENKEAKTAVRIYENLLSVDIPEDVQLAFYKKASKVAEMAGNKKLADEWKTKAIPPEPPPAEVVK